MSEYEYTPEQALSLLMKKLTERNKDLASKIQSAIDAGKDISEEESNPDKRKKPRTYRKKVPYTHAEALQIALNALESYFIEQPLFVESMTKNISETVLATPNPLQLDYSEGKDSRDWILSESKGREKTFEIELQTETQISKIGKELITLIPISHDLIVEQQNNFKLLRNLTRFFKEG
jgi:hypothetical protein